MQRSILLAIGVILSSPTQAKVCLFGDHFAVEEGRISDIKIVRTITDVSEESPLTVAEKEVCARETTGTDICAKKMSTYVDLNSGRQYIAVFNGFSKTIYETETYESKWPKKRVS